MPYPPTQPTVTLCDDLVAYLKAIWGPQTPNVAQRGYLLRIDLATVKGRTVVFFPDGYDNAPASRGEDYYTHRITALVTRRYTDAADATEIVPTEWVDREIDFVHDNIVQGLEFGRFGTGADPQPIPFASGPRSVTTLSADVVSMYDAERLAQNKEFWCAIEMVFQELIEA